MSEELGEDISKNTFALDLLDNLTDIF